MNNHQAFYLGIDGGGTKCKARIEDQQGNLLAESVSGPANVARDLKGSITSILDATNGALANLDNRLVSINELHVGLGLAGVNVPAVKKNVIDQNLPFASCHVTTDLNIACLGAHGGKDGAVIILGTGSSAVMVKNGRQVELGGHGFLLGDIASGAWIGKEAVMHTLKSLDGVQADSGLAKAVREFYGLDSTMEMVTKLAKAAPSVFASLAPTILNLAHQGQSDACFIVAKGSDYVNKLARKLLDMEPARLSFIGGLSEPLMPFLDKDIVSRTSEPLLSPDRGAIIFARQQLQD